MNSTMTTDVATDDFPYFLFAKTIINMFCALYMIDYNLRRANFAR